MTQMQMQATRPQFTLDDLVLVRDPEAFWLGKPGHTFVGKVRRSWVQPVSGRRLYDVLDLTTRTEVAGVSADYMRLLPPADAMRDIDTAPLSEPDAGALSAAAVAWLRRYLTTQPDNVTALVPR